MGINPLTGIHCSALHVLTNPQSVTSVRPSVRPFILSLLFPILQNKSVHYSRRGFRGCPVICPRRGCSSGEFLQPARLSVKLYLSLPSGCGLTQEMEKWAELAVQACTAQSTPNSVSCDKPFAATRYFLPVSCARMDLFLSSVCSL